jgi:hypothetical protein
MSCNTCPQLEFIDGQPISGGPVNGTLNPNGTCTYTYFQGTRRMTVTYPCADVNAINASNGSLEITFLDSVGNVIETFTDIPGKLDTKLCSDGTYDDEAVQGLFFHLKNYLTSKSLIDTIPFKLAAFFASIALEQRIVESTIVLTEKLLIGEITLDQFNVLVKVREQEAASLYGKDYETNFVGLVQAVNKFKYILELFILDEPCKCSNPVKKCNCNDH